MLSTSSSGSQYRHLRGPLISTFVQPPALSPSNSSPGVDSFVSQASSEHWDRGLLSNARSSESLGAASVTSARSGGSTGSGGKVGGISLGGESIWTLGKEEEAGWPPAPSSSGHGHSTQPKANPYTLGSLVPHVEALSLSADSTSHFMAKERIPAVYPDFQYRYGCLFVGCCHPQVVGGHF